MIWNLDESTWDNGLEEEDIEGSIEKKIKGKKYEIKRNMGKKGQYLEEYFFFFWWVCFEKWVPIWSADDGEKREFGQEDYKILKL